MKNKLNEIFYTRRKSYKYYYEFIENALEREYSGNLPLEHLQQHHIVPRCWFKKYEPESTMIDAPKNLVYLTVKEHIIAHLLMYLCIRDEQLKQYMLLGAESIDKGFNHNNYFNHTDSKNEQFADFCNKKELPN